MQAILIAILCSLASACAGPTFETKTSQMPDELVGEWRNSDDPVKFGVIWLLPDGRGMMVGNDKATAIGYKFVATYTSKTHTLAVTILNTEEERGPIFNFQYGPNSKTITGIEGEAPFWRVSPEVPEPIIKRFE